MTSNLPQRDHVETNLALFHCLVVGFVNTVGRYMFIEPSTYYQSDESAVLASDVIDKGEIICIQFWYYMRGQDIGSLKISIRTDKSKTLIWQLTGEQGNKWAFGQVGHKDDSASYQVRMLYLVLYQ